jgi:hypothetical protein
MSRGTENKMNRAVPYDIPGQLATPQANQKKENIFVQSLQEAGLGDLVQTETPMDQDGPSGSSPSKEGKDSSSEDSDDDGSTGSEESDAAMDKWEDEMERCLNHVLSKSDTQKALRILKQLDEIQEFTLTKESVLFFKKKKLGNIFLLFHAFFGGEKKDAQLFKQLQQFRKVLEANHVKVSQRKRYAKNVKAAKNTSAKPKKKKKKASDDDSSDKENSAPTVNQDLLNQLKK